MKATYWFGCTQIAIKDKSKIGGPQEKPLQIPDW